jgi:two-component system, NarL family, invasion response regulator UvrY
MINVLIADDHAIVRKGLKQILTETDDINVANEATNGNDVLRQTDANRYDVLVLDISMPGPSGLEVLKQLQAKGDSPPVLILSMHPEDQYGIRVLKAGAAGYLTKESAPDTLIDAVRTVASGRKYITPSLGEKLADKLNQGAGSLPRDNLSDREFQVMKKIAEGKSCREIAEVLYLSEKTISTYRTRIMDKMKFKKSAEIIRYAFENGLTS